MTQEKRIIGQSAGRAKGIFRWRAYNLRVQNENEILWTAGFLNERFTKIVSPLGWSFVGALFEQLALRDPLRYMGYPHAETIPATRLWHGHPYINAQIFQIFYKPFPGLLVPADAVRYFPHGDPEYRKRAPYPRSAFQPRFLLSLAYHLLRDPIVTTPLNYLVWDRFTAYHDAQTARLNERLDRATDAHNVLAVIAATYQLDAQLLHIHRWSLTYADLFYKLLADLTGAHAQDLMSHVPSKTRLVNAELARLAELSPPLDARLLARIANGEELSAAETQTAAVLHRFLERHGHRAFALDIAQPTFRDDPFQLLPLLASAGLNREPARIVEHAAHVDTRSKVSALVLAPLVSLARKYARLREDQRYYWHKSLAVTRRAFMILGTDLAVWGIIQVPADIFYAVRGEIQAYYGMRLGPEELARAIELRKTEWQGYAAREQANIAKAYPYFMLGDAAVAPEHKPGDKAMDEWLGRGVSAGTARGRARLVRDPRDLGRVNAGEILVTLSTDPAWTPVFGRLAGLVMERGGVLSHGAVVAREYQLPAVTAVAGITESIRDGEWIEVDGTKGRVKRVMENEKL